MKELSNIQHSWQRLLLVVLFLLVFGVVEMVVWVVVIAQGAFVLFTRSPNAQLTGFGSRLSRYAYDILRYVTFCSDLRPFPFADFPGPDSTVSNG